jgi:hypothetical protein
VRRIGVEERRARLGVRHRLAAPAEGVEAAVRSVVALHATDPATVFLSVRARTDGADIAAIERALYEERSLHRMLAMRRTMFVVPHDEAPIVQAAASNAVAAQQRKRYLQLIADAGAGGDDPAAWLDEVTDATEQALKRRGEATGVQLAQDVPRLRTEIPMAVGKSYGGNQKLTPWILLLLAAEGRIERGRPRGSWLNNQWRWLPGAPMEQLPAAEARAALVRRWLTAFGPGTVADLRWWTGWTAAHVKQSLKDVGAVEADTGAMLPDDLEPVDPPEPWVALLPALDPTPMGWQDRSWYLGTHAPHLFDRSGNIGPTVWSDGRIVGGWAQRPDGEIAFRLLEDVGRAATTAIEAEAARLSSWIGPTRVIPRFRTPLERELSS